MLVPLLLLLLLQCRTCSTSSSCKYRRQNQDLRLMQTPQQQLSLAQTQMVLLMQCCRTTMLPQQRTSTSPLLL
jgi:hypothetical protein